EKIHITTIWNPIESTAKEIIAAIKQPMAKNIDTKLIVIASIISNIIPIIIHVKNITSPP
uniref:hypothetical protein n=1 Tax=Blautia obeum TaxID=40520 RepID=UPI00319EA104